MYYPSRSRVGQGESFDGRRRQRQRDHTTEHGHPQWRCPVCSRKQFKWRTFCRHCGRFAPWVPPGPDGSMGIGPAWVCASPRRELGHGPGLVGGGSAGPDGGGAVLEAEHQAQSPVFHSPAPDEACWELFSDPGTGSQCWSSSWWDNGWWGETATDIEWQEWEMSRTGGSGRWWEHQQWQQPASNNASTWGAGPGETWVSTQACAPLGPAEPGPTGPWPTFAEVSGQDIQGSSQWL